MCEFGLDLFAFGTEGLDMVFDASTDGTTAYLPHFYIMYCDEYDALDKVVTKDLRDTIMEYSKNNPNEVINRMSYARDFLKIREQEIADVDAGLRTDRRIASDYDYGF